jgi:putative endopeptidase
MKGIRLMETRRFVVISILAALALVATEARAGERCLDPGCTMIALFDGGEMVNSGTTATTDAPMTVAKRYGTWGIDLGGMDLTIKPGDDFFGYVNGKWVATTEIPADKTSFGVFQILRDLSDDRVRAILDGWTVDKNLEPRSDKAKVAALYRSFLDEVTIEKLDVKPIEPLLDEVKKAKTRDDIARLMNRSKTSFGGSFFSVSVSDDAKDPDKYTLYLSQSGLGLSDREFYLRDNFKVQKDRYEHYVADMLRLVGWDEPEKSATNIILKVNVNTIIRRVRGIRAPVKKQHLIVVLGGFTLARR